jgi:cytochrome c biogenesis protein CcmG, thiol:disulfide interchange protein DsbE
MTQAKLISFMGAAIVLAGISFIGLRTTSRYHHHRHPGKSASHADSGGEFGAGDIAADFQLDDLYGHPVTLSEMHGKVIFLNIWATWCGPCLEEMPSMETLYEQFKDHSDFAILAVSQDRKGRDVVLPFVTKNGFRFPILLDPENKLTDLYDISGVPETFIIDRKGRIVAHHMGAFDWSRDDVKEALRELLDSKES